MPINDIVATVAERNGASLRERGQAPEDDGVPDSPPEPTTMRTGRMLPPYLHNQTLDSRGALALVGTVLGLISLWRQVWG